QVVEQAPTRALFARPLHPYTEGLLASVPRLDAPPAREHGRLHGIPGHVPAATAWPDGCRFHPRCRYAWDRCRAEAPPPLDAGRVTIDGQDVVALGTRPLRALRRRMQIVFQDPYGSLNPRMTVHQMLAEPLAIHRIARGADAERRIAALLEEVGLDPSFARS